MIRLSTDITLCTFALVRHFCCFSLELFWCFFGVLPTIMLNVDAALERLWEHCASIAVSTLKYLLRDKFTYFFFIQQKIGDSPFSYQYF